MAVAFDLVASLVLSALVASSIARADNAPPSATTINDVETIKLTCELDVIVYHPYGEPSKSHETEEVEMQFDVGSGFKAISVDSITVPVNVTNGKGGAITSYVDNSDANRWDISSDRQRAGSLSQQSAAIDRNTGRLTVYVITTVGNTSERAEARGTCVKVDTTTRKF
jgi:hypothetical protein